MMNRSVLLPRVTCLIWLVTEARKDRRERGAVPQAAGIRNPS